MKLSFGINKRKYEFNIGKAQAIQETKDRPSKIQIRDTYAAPFASSFNSYQLLKCNIGLFRTIRESIPFANVAILKRIKLIGNFEIETYGNKALLEKITDFKKNVQVNSYARGINSFIADTTDSTFTTGFGVGEIIPTKSMTDIWGLKTARTEDIRFIKHEDRLILGTRDENGFKVIPFEQQNLITYLAFDQRDGHPQGYSILQSLPFVAQIFLRMEKAWENKTWRVGSPTFVITVTGGKGQTAQEANDTKDEIKNALQGTMQVKKTGQESDIAGAVAEGGKVDISTLGADGEVITDEVPVRTIEEQIIAQLELAPYMLGVAWSTTERMSQHQSDMIVSNVKWERDRLEYIIRQVIDTFLILTGDIGAKWDMRWNDVNLLDEKERAMAGFLDAQRILKMIEAVATMIEHQWMDAQGAEDYLRAEGVIKGKMPKDWYASVKGKQFVYNMAMALLGERENGDGKKPKLFFPADISGIPINN